MSWLGWTLIYIFSIVAYYFFSKKLFNEDKGVDARFYGGILQLAVGIFGLIPALIEGWRFDWNITSAFWLVIVAVTYTIGPSLYYTGLKHTHLSVTTTLDSVGVVYALILGTLILHEPWRWDKLVGIGIILTAIVIVSEKKSSLMKFNKYELLLLVAPFFYAIGGVADKTLVDYSNASTYLSLSFLVAGICMTSINIPRLKYIQTKSLKSSLFIKTLGINAVFIAIAAYSSYRAYLLGGEISIMYPIMQTESVVVPFMAMWLLGERDRFVHKIAGAILAFVGVIILSNSMIISW